MTRRAGLGARPRALAPMALPQAAALTDLLVGEARPTGSAMSGAQIEAVRCRLETTLGRLRRRAGGPWRVTGYALRRAAVDPGDATGGPVFRWSATTARRPVGLAGLRAYRTGTARSPADAVAATVASLAADGRHGLGRAGSLTEWIGRLAAPALTIVQAEATAWATSLWTAVEWDRLGPHVRVGGPSPQWSPASSPGTSLRGRADVRVTGPDGAETILTVLPGSPGTGSREELGLTALTTALGRGGGPGPGDATVPPRVVPARVAGWWPDCGRALVVPVDGALLEETADAVLRAVAVLAGHTDGSSSEDRGGEPGR